MGFETCDEVLIGGRWERAEGGTYPVIDPATEEVAGHAPETSVAQVKRAAEAVLGCTLLRDPPFIPGLRPVMSEAEEVKRPRLIIVVFDAIRSLERD